MADRQTDRPGGGSALGTARSLFLYGSKVPPSLARREFSKSHKLLILSIIAFGAFLVPLGTGIYLPMLDDVQKDLKTSATAINGTLTIYLLVLAIGPLGWSTLADNWGRRPVYLMSIVVFIGGCVGCGLSPNVGVLMACRFLQAAGGSSVMSVGAGTISDVFKVEERARAMSMYYLGPLLGPGGSSSLVGYSGMDFLTATP